MKANRSFNDVIVKFATDSCNRGDYIVKAVKIIYSALNRSQISIEYKEKNKYSAGCLANVMFKQLTGFLIKFIVRANLFAIV